MISPSYDLTFLFYYFYLQIIWFLYKTFSEVTFTSGTQELFHLLKIVLFA